MSKLQGVLARLVIHKWSGRKVDKRVGDEVIEMKAAEKRAGSYTKILVPSSAFTDLNHCAQYMKGYLMTLSRPWGDDGRRFVPTSYQEHVEREFALWKRRFESEVNSFVGQYPLFVKEAERRLGQMFDPADFPDETVIRGMFDMEMIWEPVPSGDTLTEHKEFQGLAKAIDEQAGKAFKEGARALFHTTRDAIETVASRIHSYEQRIRELEAGQGKPGAMPQMNSALEDLRELAARLPALNIEKDPLLDQVAERLQEKIFNPSADLKEDAASRHKIQAEIDRMVQDFKARAAKA